MGRWRPILNPAYYLWLVDCFSNQKTYLKTWTHLRCGGRLKGPDPCFCSSMSELWSDKADDDVWALTVRTLGQRHLLDACPIPTGKHLHLTLVLVELAVWPTDRLVVVTAVPVASATFKLLLLQTAEHIVALVRLHKTCRGKKGFQSPMKVGRLCESWQAEHHNQNQKLSIAMYFYIYTSCDMAAGATIDNDINNNKQ